MSLSEELMKKRMPHNPVEFIPKHRTKYIINIDSSYPFKKIEQHSDFDVQLHRVIIGRE